MGTTISASNTPFGTMSQVLADSTAIRTRLDRLTQQSSDGLVATSYAGLSASASQTSLNLNPEIANLTTWQSNIAAASGSMQVAQGALTQMNSIAASFFSQMNNLNGLDPSSVTDIAASAQQALQQVAGLLDTTDGGAYVFAGQDSANPPVPNPAAIGSSGFATQIGSAVATLGTGNSASVNAATLAVAQSNAAGTSPFSAALSQPAAAVAALAPSIQSGPGQTAIVGLLASANTMIPASSGPSTTGSYTRDLMRSLAVIASLTPAMFTNGSDVQGVVSDTRTALNDAVTGIANEAGVLGEQQSSLTTLSTGMSNTATALSAQLSSAQNVDMTATLSALTQTQTQMQASYQLIAGISSLSLVKYI